MTDFFTFIDNSQDETPYVVCMFCTLTLHLACCVLNLNYYNIKYERKNNQNSKRFSRNKDWQQNNIGNFNR